MQDNNYSHSLINGEKYLIPQHDDKAKINENYDPLIFDNCNKLKNIIDNLHIDFNI